MAWSAFFDKQGIKQINTHLNTQLKSVKSTCNLFIKRAYDFVQQFEFIISGTSESENTGVPVRSN